MIGARPFTLCRVIIAAITSLSIAVGLILINYTEFNWLAFTFGVLLPTILALLLSKVFLIRKTNRWKSLLDQMLLFKAIAIALVVVLFLTQLVGISVCVGLMMKGYMPVVMLFWTLSTLLGIICNFSVLYKITAPISL